MWNRGNQHETRCNETQAKTYKNFFVQRFYTYSFTRRTDYYNNFSVYHVARVMLFSVKSHKDNNRRTTLGDVRTRSSKSISYQVPYVPLHSCEQRLGQLWYQSINLIHTTGRNSTRHFASMLRSVRTATIHMETTSKWLQRRPVYENQSSIHR